MLLSLYLSLDPSLSLSLSLEASEAGVATSLLYVDFAGRAGDGT